MTDVVPVSQRPYLVRAIHEWICDNGYTPYLLVDAATEDVVVPREHVEDGRIVLNVSPQATDTLQIGNQAVTFNARFSGRPMQLEIPIEAVLAIYARENGQGMLFASEPDGGGNGDGSPQRSRNGPNLKVVK